jgi:tRNA U34 5-carboxymethylaminomethyl modifying GTPase MnmE/TrmE
MTLPRLSVAVVGHTNTGKTSLLRTLLRDVTFGEVSDRPATTRDVSGTVLLVSGEPLVELYDTPGLEDSISLLELLDSLRAEQREDPIEIIHRFLANPEAHNRFSQEAKALRQLIKSDVALYVIDARDRPLPKHRDELAILAMCARPIVPVLNFIARPEAQTAAWREQLSRLNLHAVAEFDTVVVDEQSEQRLFEKMRTLLDQFQPTLDALIEDRRAARERLIAASARLIADLLVDAAAATFVVPAGDDRAMREATDRLRHIVRQREQRCVRDLLELHRFHPDDCDPSNLPVEDGQWGLDLFSPEAMKQFGIRTGSAAAAGAMAGLAIDVAVGGVSLGAAAATGAAIGAAISAGHSHGKRLLNRLRGRSELRCDAATLHLLAARQIDLTRALLTRGHAAQDRLHMRDSSTAASRSGAERSRPSLALPQPLVRARSKTAWSSLSQDESAGSQRGSSWTFSSSAREAAVDELASMLRPSLHQPRSAPASLPVR